MHLEGDIAHAVFGRLAVGVDALVMAGQDDDVVLVHLADGLYSVPMTTARFSGVVPHGSFRML
jgi:hypothetical protein